jgi:aminomethyltransferase
MAGHSAPGPLSTTVLHGWHVAHGARMVPFGGWDMPVQYGSGILREHLATRREAGLFDVSHMGRYRVRGAGAQAWLCEVLTNNAAALAPGQAQYTLLANEQGGAIDDAYLYRLDAHDFLLVVNASNRDKDWTWLQGQLPAPDVSLEDASEALAMIALQGPRSAAMLATLVPQTVWPENRRNRLATVKYGGTDLVVARTGYTGEGMCFEFFCPRGNVVGLWERFVALGAMPCGLGARDSLRLEAGLPLYGHELGVDAEGREIPVFAIDLARFAVRMPRLGDYVGREALDAQRAEVAALREGRAPHGPRLVPRRVLPIAMSGTRKPLRAGYRLALAGQSVGYVTSGTTVPSIGPSDGPDAEPVLRPIGLALVDADLRYRRDPPVRLDVDDGRGGNLVAEVVERHLQRS